jgi:hypothetical protein
MSLPKWFEADWTHLVMAHPKFFSNDPRRVITYWESLKHFAHPLIHRAMRDAIRGQEFPSLHQLHEAIQQLITNQTIRSPDRLLPESNSDEQIDWDANLQQAKQLGKLLECDASNMLRQIDSIGKWDDTRKNADSLSKGPRNGGRLG